MAVHIALLGDSIFDNGSYTEGQPDVIAHLRAILAEGSTASSFAIDGSATVDLEAQAAQLPPGVSHAVVSVGGNDAMLNGDLLDMPVASTREALLLFEQRARAFEASYRAALQSVRDRVGDVTVCTVYEGNLPDTERAPARAALMLFNDAILRVAFDLRCAVLDLRTVCVDPADYANPVEPSGTGGAKIAHAIAAALGVSRRDGPHGRRSCVFGG